MTSASLSGVAMVNLFVSECLISVADPGPLTPHSRGNEVRRKVAFPQSPQRCRSCERHDVLRAVSRWIERRVMSPVRGDVDAARLRSFQLRLAIGNAAAVAVFLGEARG